MALFARQRNHNHEPENAGKSMQPFGFFNHNFPMTMRRLMGDDSMWSELDGLLHGEAYPKVDMHEDKKTIKVSAELPGVEADNVTVEIKDDALIIQGEKRSASDDSNEDEGWHRTERSYGFFRRVLPLPASVDRDSAKATFKSGVLSVVMTKDGKVPPNRKQIPIDVA